MIESFFEKRAYPVMKEAAEFLLTSMVEDDKGRLLIRTVDLSGESLPRQRTEPSRS